MALAAGARLGPYEILSPLGAGGMGEVYRARDTRLGREVAVKVLPGELSADPERVRRFEQEARSASALDHPNIITIYDIGSADSTLYIAMQYVEGKTLRELLSSGPSPTKKVLEISVQIAEGLAKAHAAGIMHRDLKPENVMVSKDGFVKILDFGLAKLTAPQHEEQLLSELPTAMAETRPGVVMGTVGYMSPEQASGKTLDFRSDQFSFGSILYELSTGKRAFQRGTTAETLAAIIREEPEPVGAINPRAPAPMRWIIERCLAKDPDERFGTTRDLARDLASIRDHLSEAVTVSGEARAAAPATRGMRLWPFLLGAGILAASVLVSFSLGRNTGKMEPPSFHKLTYRRGFVSSARFAPDGQTVFYAASWDGAEKPQLFSTRLENPASLRLSLPDGHVESISRGGEMLILSNVAFFAGSNLRKGTLSSAPLSGAASRDLHEDVADADWSPDGRSLALVRAPQWRYRLEFPAGKVLYEKTSGWISHPRVSPSGDAVAFLDHAVMGDDRGDVAMVDQSGKKTTLSTGWDSAQGLAWSASGDEIWFTAAEATSARALYAVTRSGRRRLVAGSPAVLTLQDVSKDGRVLMDSANDRVGLLGLSAADPKERDLSGLDWSLSPILSEDGKTLVFTEEGAGGGAGYSVYLRKMDGWSLVRLGEGSALDLSPDGKWVLASLLRSSPISLVLLPTGAGEPRPLPKDSIDHAGWASFFPDGRRILFVGSEPGHARRCWVQNLDGGKPRPVTSEGVVGAILSPDGRSFAARVPDQKPALYPVEGGPPRPIEGLEPGEFPLRWSSDGRSLFVGQLAPTLTARVYRVEVSSGRRELWKEFTPRDPTGLIDLYAGAVTPDGKLWSLATTTNSRIFTLSRD